jgi:predicted metal-dependent hydrolase
VNLVAGSAPLVLSQDTRRALVQGCRLFEARRFFDAHEVWEDAWRIESGEVRRALQGLIQVAAGFHAGLVRGRPAGMAKLLGSGFDRLASTGRVAGLDDFLAEVARWREAARRWADGGERPDLPVPRLPPAW